MESDHIMGRVLVAATEAFVSSDDNDLPPVAATAAADCLAALVSQLPSDQRRLLRMGTSALQAISLLRYGRRFHRLPTDRARRLLQRLERAPLKPLRRLHRVLKMLCQYAYFAGEETWAACGYGGPWLGRIDVAADAAPDVGDLS